MEDISFSNEFLCTSAPTSARFNSNEEENIICFYSVPTSPSLKARAYEDANSNTDEFEFEFETSRRFNNPSDFQNEKQKKRSQRQSSVDSLPAMAFADELFCDGKVLPLGPPLKLPPRLQNGSIKKTSMPSGSSLSSSPRSPLGLSFLHRSLWNDDFDPFMVALEKVREGEEKRGKSKGRHGIRRTRSLTPFRGKSPIRPSGPDMLSEPRELVFARRAKSPHRPINQHWGPYQPLKQRPRSPTRPSDLHCGPAEQPCEPKRLEFGRRVRLVGVDKNGPKRSKEERERGGAWIRKRKREKIMRFLFGKASSQQHKIKDKIADLGNIGFLSKLGLDKDETQTVSEVSKMTLACYKPRLLLCLGYGGRYVK